MNDVKIILLTPFFIVSAGILLLIKKIIGEWP